MTPQRLANILSAIGANNVRVKAGKVECSCLLAKWTHSGARDSTPSMVVFPEGRHGDPIYSCQACHEKGALRDLVCTLWVTSGRNMMHIINAIDGPRAPINVVSSISKNPVALAQLNRLKEFKRKGGGYETHRRKRQDTGPWFDRRAIELSDQVPEIPFEELAPHLTDVVHPYAAKRGIELDTWLTWELGVDIRMKRILFPMRDHHGRLVAISGRLYDEETCIRCGGKMVKVQGVKKGKFICGRCGKNPSPKYLHSSGFKRNLMLYGEHHFEKRNNKVYLVEGHMDAVKMWQHGYRPTVALLGSSPGEPQIERLIFYAAVTVVVSDGDQAGSDMFELVKHMVAGRIPVLNRRCPEGKDPGKMHRLELVELLGDPWGKDVDRQLPMV